MDLLWPTKGAQKSPWIELGVRNVGSDSLTNRIFDITLPKGQSSFLNQILAFRRKMYNVYYYSTMSILLNSK